MKAIYETPVVELVKFAAMETIANDPDASDTPIVISGDEMPF